MIVAKQWLCYSGGSFDEAGQVVRADAHGLQLTPEQAGLILLSLLWLCSKKFVKITQTPEDAFGDKVSALARKCPIGPTTNH